MWHLASSRQAGRESSKKAEVIILCSLVKEVTSRQLFHNILVISKPQDPYTMEGYFTRVQIQGNRYYEGHRRGCLPDWSRTGWIGIEAKVERLLHRPGRK